MKTLLVSDGALDLSAIEGEVSEHIDLRNSEDTSVNLMDLYESLKPEMIRSLREKIVAIKPERIVAVGKLEDYLWNGTVISRCFGQFNSWNNQRSNPFGKTIIKVDGEPVELIAIASLNDWEYVNQ